MFIKKLGSFLNLEFIFLESKKGEHGAKVEAQKSVPKAPSFLQDPSIQIEQLTEIEEILSRLTKLTKEQLHAIRQKIDVFGVGERRLFRLSWRYKTDAAFLSRRYFLRSSKAGGLS